jgi:hypothetical protein
MTGFVLHPGHHELHGVTVVVETPGGTVVGRFDTRDERGVHLVNVARHDPAESAESLETFLTRTRRFGVKAERKHLILSDLEVVRIRRLADLA